MHGGAAGLEDFASRGQTELLHGVVPRRRLCVSGWGQTIGAMSGPTRSVPVEAVVLSRRIRLGQSGPFRCRPDRSFSGQSTLLTIQNSESGVVPVHTRRQRPSPDEWQNLLRCYWPGAVVTVNTAPAGSRITA